MLSTNDVISRLTLESRPGHPLFFLLQESIRVIQSLQDEIRDLRIAGRDRYRNIRESPYVGPLQDFDEMMSDLRKQIDEIKMPEEPET